MKHIIIFYWHLAKYDDLSYEHNQRYIYSENKRNAIINKILSKGYNLMVLSFSDDDTLTIMIDKGRFKQS